jgi:hypothetical protein
MLRRSLTEQNDFGIFNTTCASTLWCSLRPVFQDSERSENSLKNRLIQRSENSLENRLIQRFWLLVLADLTEMNGQELLTTVQLQHNCDLKQLEQKCPLVQLWDWMPKM